MSGSHPSPLNYQRPSSYGAVVVTAEDEELAGGVSRSRSNSLASSTCSIRDVSGTATIVNQVCNLVKNLVGCGVLALPSGVAAFANAPSAVIPAAIYTIIAGAIFGFYFLLIGKTCRLTRRATYREIWEETMGDNGAVFVALINVLKPALANLAYSMILADTFHSLFATIGFNWTRTAALMFITIVGLLPLCLFKNIQVLAPFSLVGTIGMFATALVMGVRYFDGTYDPDRSGIYLQELPESFRPSFGTMGAARTWSSPRVLVFICMLFEAYVAHYNAPRFYMELHNNTVPRFKVVVNYAFTLTGIIYVLMTTFGFLTFGANCDGYILNNYSNQDALATFCRLAIAVAIVFTYPLTFIGYRDGVLDLFQVPMEKQTPFTLNVLTVVLLAIVTILAMVFEDLGLVNAIGGGTFATAIVFVFPALMYRAAILHKQKQYEDGARDGGAEHVTVTRGQLNEAKLAIALMWVGVTVGVIGVWIAIADEEHKKSELALGTNST